MVDRGAFEDVDFAITWHPHFFSGVTEPLALAYKIIDFEFHGRASHAAASPHTGRSALDAAELMSVGINYLREHMVSSARVHYSYLDAGGRAPNVVQRTAKVRYCVRCEHTAGLDELVARVIRVSEGAAIMTGTLVSHEYISACSNLLPNQNLEDAMHREFIRIGPPPFDADDRSFARLIQATFPKEDIVQAFHEAGVEYADDPLCVSIAPKEMKTKLLSSTDVGDVSWVVPTVQANGATHAIATSFHSWQWTAQGKTPYAHKGMIHAATVMAATAAAVISNPDLLAKK